MFGVLESLTLPTAGVFATYEEMFNDLNHRMLKDGYKIVKSRSHRVRVNGTSVPGSQMTRVDLVCHRGGRPYKSNATKHKTSTKKTNCPWMAKAVWRRQFAGWMLTVVCDQHNHEPGTPEPDTDAESVEEAPPTDLRGKPLLVDCNG